MWSTFDGVGAAVCRYLLIASVSALGLVALAWIVIRVGRVKAAVYRHSIWLYCLAGIVVVPLLWMHVPKLKLAVLPPSAPALPSAMDLPEWKLPARPAAPAASAPMPPIIAPATPAPVPPAPPRTPAISARTAIAALWAVGVALMLLRLALGWFRLRRICRAAKPFVAVAGRPSADGEAPSEPSAARIAGDVAPAYTSGVAKPPPAVNVVAVSVPEPRLLVTSDLGSPVCCGVFSPVILLPEELVDSDDPSRLRMALNHELAHIERRDIAANALQRLVEALFFFHPLVWYASRLLTHERERVCDNWVIAQGADADRYAEFLADLAERAVRRQRLAGVALCENGLVGRVKDLLDPRHARLTRASRLAALACALAAILAFGVFGVLRLSRAEEKAVAPRSAYSIVEFADADPKFEGKAAYGDTVTVLDYSGKQTWTLGGFNTCETVGAGHSIIWNDADRSLWLCEFAGRRLVKVSGDGRILFEKQGLSVQAIARDPKRGEIWALTSNKEGTISGKDIVVLDAEGRVLRHLPLRGIDIVYSRAEDCFWVAGKRVTKTDREGRVLSQTVVDFPWASVAIDVSDADGAAYVLERVHPDVRESGSRLHIFSRDGKEHRTVSLGKGVYMGLAVDSAKGTVWLSEMESVRKLTLAGNEVAKFPVHGFSVCVEPDTGCIWVGGNKGLYRLNPEGQELARVRGTCWQRWLCVAPLIGLTATEAGYADMLALYPDAAKLKLPMAEEIRKLGAVWPSVPPEMNAAYYFALAGRAMPPEADKPDGAANVGADRPYTGDLAALVKWVERNREALRLYRDATRLNYCRFPLVWSPDSPQLYAPTPVWVRQVAWSACDAAFVAELQGRPAEAVAFYADCLRAGALLRRQGTENSAQLLGVATCSAAQGRLAALTANATMDEATLREVIRCLHDAEVAPTEAAQALGNEVAYSDAVAPLRRDAADAALVSTMWHVQRTAWKDFVRGKTLTQLLQRDAIKALTGIGASLSGTGKDIGTPAIIMLFRDLGRCDARLKAQELRAALTLYRQTHNGAWPDSLDALVPGILPAIPLDPFDGKPMRYARAGNGWKVWSVGEDNVDNGGQGDPDPVKVWNGPDFVFISEVPSNLERRSGGKMKAASAAPSLPRTEEEYRKVARDAVLAALPKQVTATRVALNMAETPVPKAVQGSAATQRPVLVLSFDVTTPPENEPDMLLKRLPEVLRGVTLSDRKIVVVKDVLVTEPLRMTVSAEATNRPSRILFSCVSVVLMGFDEFRTLTGDKPSPGTDPPGSPARSAAPQKPATYADMLAMYPNAASLRMPTADEMRHVGALWPQVPPEENAAYWYDRAAMAALCIGEPMGSLLSLDPYGGDRAAFGVWVRDNAEALDLLKKGLGLASGARPPFFDSTTGSVSTMPQQLAASRHLARVVVDAGFNEELNGRPEAAAEWYASDIRMGAQMRRGTLIADLVGIAVSSIGNGPLNGLVANADLPASTLRRIIEQARAAESSPDEIKCVLDHEVLLAYGRGDPAVSALHNEAQRSLSMPLSAYLADSLTQRLLNDRGDDSATNAANWAHFRTQLGRADASLRALQIRAAIALFSKERGGPPDALTELVPVCLPAVPADPFDGKPMRYARTGATWKLWSVGPDLKDDGGTVSEGKPGFSWAGPDYVFISKLPSALERQAAWRTESAKLPPIAISPEAGDDMMGLTPLHYAANRGDAAEVARLLRAGADVHARGKCGQTALHLAATGEVAGLLLERGADPVARSPLGLKTPIEWAISGDRRDVVERLRGIEKVRNEPSPNPAQVAVDLGRNEIALLLIRLGESPKFVLNDAIRVGNAALVERLVSTGVVPDKDDAAMALQQRDLDMLAFCVSKGVKPDIYAAVALGLVAEVRQFLKDDPTLLNKPGPMEWTPLYWAVVTGQRAMVALLIEAGADVNSRVMGETPLHGAAGMHLELARGPVAWGARALGGVQGDRRGRSVDPAGTLDELLARGANVNALTDNGMTPLMVAVRSFNTPAIELLLRRGADRTIKDKSGKTALEYAKETHFGEMVRMLEKAK